MLHVRLRREYSVASPMIDAFRDQPSNRQTVNDTSPFPASQNCVYTLYADEVLLYNETLAEARSALEQAGVPSREWPAEIAGVQKSRNESVKGDSPDRGQSAEEATEQKMQEVMQDVDPSLKAFLE